MVVCYRTMNARQFPPEDKKYIIDNRVVFYIDTRHLSQDLGQLHLLSIGSMNHN